MTNATRLERMALSGVRMGAIPEEIERKIRRTDSCWIWNGYLSRRQNGKESYGRIMIKRKNYQAHRLIWILAKGEIPAGKQVLHRCDNPPCVNPDHLFLGTPFDNMQDAEQKGRLKHPRRIVCPSGHLYVGKNVRWYYQKERAKWTRYCRECGKRYRREYRQRKRAAYCRLSGALATGSSQANTNVASNQVLPYLRLNVK